jgi:hypothetical protein
VIGVSKRCCPICDHFLSILRNRRDNLFLVRGSHGTISSCTLPPWTPSDIVDEMIDKFGSILINDLLSFKEKVYGVQGHTLERSISSGSGTLSLDSDEGHGGGSMIQGGLRAQALDTWCPFIDTHVSLYLVLTPAQTLLYFQTFLIAALYESSLVFLHY